MDMDFRGMLSSSEEIKGDRAYKTQHSRKERSSMQEDVRERS